MIELNIEGIKFTIETKEALYKHETNNFIKELPGIKNNIKFNNALIILNRWAKNNFVNQERFGFLDEYSISIMLTKINILYPNVSLIELIERFFLTYLTWLEINFLNRKLRNILKNILYFKNVKTKKSYHLSKKNFLKITLNS
ncbi:unnamed protein product [Meloidogyne enterolobii]|uniref:Uncharacterized protein n=1 Tax=Meloidogyne enterolobii TaxID=390850 RepID=A0ACB1A7Q5_MELEN